MMNKIKRLMPLLILCVILISPNIYAGPFSEGSARASVAIGNGRYFNDDYLIIGVGAGYYFVDGLEVGLDVDFWTSGDPAIREVTPSLQYVFHQTQSIKPYLGVFYNRTYINRVPDTDAAGYRVGFYIPAGNRAYFGYGIVSSKLQDCDDTIFIDCSDTYSELTLMFTL